ncbi:RHS repeat domain-containing protein [Niabella aquatica]
MPSKVFGVIVGWIKEQSSGLLTQQLKYDDASGSYAQYNGNIGQQLWNTNGQSHSYNYTYDRANRLLSGISDESYNETMSYDKMGNIQNLTRQGPTGMPGLGTLGYSCSGNQLQSVSGGYSRSYTYNSNGSMISDGTLNIQYNELNLPKQVTGTPVGTLNYTYDAGGSKLTKQTVSETRQYIDGIEYVGTAIDLLHTEVGIARNSAGTYTYEFFLADHLGNTRVVVNEAGTVLQQADYYPFGLPIEIYKAVPNNYLYQSKELQRELTQFDFGARFYDPQIGRWHVVDPLADKREWVSPYGFVQNNPISRVDPTGAFDNPIYDREGNFLGTDDRGLQGAPIIMNKEDFTQGMAHADAVKKDLAPNGGAEYYKAIPDWNNYYDFYNHYNSLPNRPDYDGFVTIREGIDWAKSHPGALQNPTPDNMLYIDASKLDFGNITTKLFVNGVGKSSPINLNTPGNFAAAQTNYTLASTVYALGRVNITLLNNAGSVKIVNDDATDYDWNKGGSIWRKGLINYERWSEGLNDTHGFKTFYYGIGQLRP